MSIKHYPKWPLGLKVRNPRNHRGFQFTRHGIVMETYQRDGKQHKTVTTWLWAGPIGLRLGPREHRSNT